MGFLTRIFGFWAPGLVPQGAHRDFLQVPGLNSSRSLTWTRKWPSIFPGKILSIFAPLRIPSPQGTLTEKEGTNNVYLDTQVMGSNPGIRSRSYGEGPQIPKVTRGSYNLARYMVLHFQIPIGEARGGLMGAVNPLEILSE